MKKLILIVAFLALFYATAFAKEPQTDHWLSPDESQLIEHKSYVNSKGHVVHSPAHSKSNGVTSGASAQCRDGTYSFSQSRRGTCSHHHGVASWL